MANSQSYWTKREQKWQASNFKKDQDFNKKLQSIYDQAFKDINDQINQFYMSYAKHENITMAEAMQRVKAHDVQAFSATAKKMVKEKDFSDQANAQLKLYNTTMKVNRLEMLKSQIGATLVDAGASVESEMKSHLSKSYVDEVTRQAGILGQDRDDDLVKRASSVVNASFQGAQWSSRLWLGMAELQTQLGVQLSQAMMFGLNPRTIAKNLMPLIKDTIGNKRAAAERLAITEMARVQDDAQMSSFRKYGIKYVLWIAEPGACKVCQDIASYNNGIYPIDDVPYIPEHPYCRCAKAAYVKKGSIKPAKVANSTIETEEATSVSPRNLGSVAVKGKPMSVEKADHHNANPNYMGGDTGQKLIVKRDEALKQCLEYRKQNDKYYQQYHNTYNKEDWDKAIHYENLANKFGTTYNKLCDEIEANRAKYKSYSVNCQRCAPTYELRRRGYDVEALPNNGGTHHDVYEIPANMWRNKDGSISQPAFVDANTNRQVTKALVNQMTPGERGTIQWSWKGANSAHIVNVERTKDGILVVDAQPGRTAKSFEEYMGEAKFKNRVTQKGVQYRTGVFYNRTDDKYIDMENIAMIVKAVK